jgi:putative nucleotidyltransferase with HDIG domain
LTTVLAEIEAGREAERAGRPLEARGHFEAALQLLRADQALDLAAKLLRWVAWTHTTGGDPHAALDCLEAAEAVAVAMKDDLALASVLNTRAGTLFSMGELDQAESLFERVRDLATSAGARKLEAITDQNLGNVASIRGDAVLAVGRFQASLAKFEALGEASYVGPLLNNIGRLQADLLDDGSAAATLDRARELCVQLGDRHHLIIVEVNRARVMLSAGDAREAIRTAEEASTIARDCGDDRWLGDILLVSGSAHLRLGAAEHALNLLDRAAHAARTREDPKLMADVILEQAQGLRHLGRNRDTLLRLNQARKLFEGLRAQRDLAHVGERLVELETAFLQIVREWGESIESKDAYTQGHSSRVADYACMLAAAVDLPKDEMMWFRMGALLHDVGKVSIPLEILTKPGQLDNSEWTVMASHPVLGVDLLEGIEFPWDVRPMIRHHHERWDGSGYPDAIAGSDIPLEARILTIADVYDALTTTRSYRAAFSHDKAMEIMRAERGKTVDPTLFALFASELSADVVTPRSLATYPGVSATPPEKPRVPLRRGRRSGRRGVTPFAQVSTP